MDYPGRHAGDDGQQRRHAARAAVHADSRAGHGDRTSSQGTRASRSSSRLDKSIDGAATDVQAAITQAMGSLPVDLPIAADVLQDQPQRPADPLHRPQQHIVTAGQALRLRQHAGRPADQHPCRASARWPCTARSRPCGSRPTPPRWPPADLTMDDLAAAVRNGTSYTGAGQFDGPQRHVPPPAERPIGESGAVRPADRRHQERRADVPPRRRQGRRFRSGRADQHALLGRGNEVPSATVVRGRLPAGRVERRARWPSSVKRPVAEIQATLPGSVRIMPIYDRSQTIVNSVNDVQCDAAASPSCWW